MGRAERRKAERRNRIENRKGKILMSREEIGEMKQKFPVMFLPIMWNLS